MKTRILEKWLISLTSVFIIGLPSVSLSSPSDGGVHADDGGELNVEIEYFNTSSSKSTIGNTEAQSSGLRFETEYEKNNIAYSFAYERWSYDWTNPENFPIDSGGSAPWDTFGSLQFGFEYEHGIGDDWELTYYAEAESSYEKERGRSNEYELGVGINYELSDAWHYTLSLNVEYLDATSEMEVGGEVEIEWNHDSRDGWSGEFEISDEFPESNVDYHFTEDFSTSFFYYEGGTNTMRLSDGSPVEGMQGGYIEDEYRSLGIGFNYEYADHSYVSFSVQQNFDRSMSFVDSTGLEATETIVYFDDSPEVSLRISYTF